MTMQLISERLLMMLTTIATAVIAVIALSSVVAGQEQKGATVNSNDILGPYDSPPKVDEGDPVLLKIQTGVAKFEAGLEAARKPIREELEKRKQEAQKSGVLRKLDEATVDIAAFEASDKLPATLMAIKPELTKKFRKDKEEAQKQMIKDYEAGIKGYTLLGKIPDATVVKKVLEEFKASLRAPQTKIMRRRRRR
jgi:hypothetical protein